MLLKVMAFTTDVRDHLETVGKTHFCHLAQSRVRLLRGGGIHAGTNAAPLRTASKSRGSALVGLGRPGLAHQLIDRGHLSKAPTVKTCRSGERRVGQGCVSTFSSRWSPNH